jgi:hypothetical protein
MAPWTARAASLGIGELLVADEGEHGTESLVADHVSLADLAQSIELGVGQLSALKSYLQPTVQIVANRHMLAGSHLRVRAGSDQVDDFVVLQSEGAGDRTGLLPTEQLG